MGEYKLASKLPDDVHGLDAIMEALLSHPRRRHLVVCEVVNGHTGIDHPEHDEDVAVPKLAILEITAITDRADQDQLRAMVARLRRSRPGQASLDEAVAE